MAKHGGARQGAGRKPGSVTVRSTEALAEAMEGGILPVEYMLELMRDDTNDEKIRSWAAEKAAPYCHPRPAPVPRTVEIELPDISTVEGIQAAIAKVAQEAAAGNIAPAEAQSFISIIDTQRDAITTAEILTRLDAIEQRQGGR